MAATSTIPSSGTSQVRVRLRTNDDTLQLPEEIGALLIAASVRRYELSLLVNKLLNAEKGVPLEFLINGQFLRTTLEEFLDSNGISTETTLNIEYVRAFAPPSDITTLPHDDWVSSVAISAPLGVFSGSYDGQLRVWDSGSVISSVSAHEGGVKAVEVAESDVISAGVDRTIKIWNYNDNFTPSLELYGHRSSVDDLAVHQASRRILSASADHTVGVWSTSKSGLPSAPEELLPQSNKRRKVSHQSTPFKQGGPKTLLTGHSAQVSGVCFDHNASTIGYSCSWDHSVKTWDLLTSTCVDTRTTSQPLYCIEHLPELGLLATGTSARHLTLVDPREGATTVAAMTLVGHTNSISSVARNPGTNYIVSGSHDSTCRVWDLRAAKGTDAVYVLHRQGRERPGRLDAKVLDVAWDKSIGIAAAGEDKKVEISTLS